MAIPPLPFEERRQVLMLVGFWLESMVYGFYTIMFLASMVISLKTMRGRGTAAVSLVFVLSKVSMFIMITIYTGINLYRGIRAYALVVVPPNPIDYYSNFAMWDNYAFGIIVTMLVWHADALVIYRCYIIWNRNLYVIILPSMLLMLSFVINTIGLAAFKFPVNVPKSVLFAFLSMVYPLNITQSIISTGLISWKIWKQHRQNTEFGIAAGSSGVGLLQVLRIIIESALIFTVQQILLMIFNEINHPAEYIFHATLVPSIGIVFVLMTLRTHYARTASEARWTGNGTRSGEIELVGPRPPRMLSSGQVVLSRSNGESMGISVTTSKEESSDQYSDYGRVTDQKVAHVV